MQSRYMLKLRAKQILVSVKPSPLFAGMMLTAISFLIYIFQYSGSGNTYAAHSAPSSSAQPAQTGTNPYARPISAGSVQQTDAADTAQRARRSRMQRYHEAENENGKSENL